MNQAAKPSGNAIATLNSVQAVERANDAGSIMEAVIVKGDLAKLEPAERARYYVEVCRSVGLNPLTRPFDYITLNGKLVLYPNRGAADQLRALQRINVRIVGKERVEDVYVVTVEATAPDGRTDSDIGAVTLGNLRGDGLANALMKAITKAKRRVTLSICGLNMPDETEVETIPTARRVVVNPETEEIVETGEIDPEQAADAAANPGAGGDDRARDPDAISDAQRKKLWASWREKLPDDKDGALLHAVARETYGINESLWELSKADASGLIDWIATNPAAALRQYAADVARKQAIARGQQELPGTAETQGHLELSPQEQTWLGNIARAVSIERLDQIAENLTNLGLLGQPALAEALETRRREIAAERAARFRG